MIIFTEALLISIFCFLFFHSTNSLLWSGIYFVVFFSLRLWMEIIDNEKFKKLIFIVVIALTFALDVKAVIFLSVFLTINFKNEDKYFKWSLIPLSVIFANTNPLFSSFSAVIFFYAIIKENYFLAQLKYLDLQDSLNKQKMEIKKQKIILENESLKNTEASILSERNRISSELHNSIGHSLSSAILQVNALQYMTQEQEVKDKLSVLQKSLEDGMQEIRECLHNIKKDAFNLESSLEEFLKTIPNIKFNLKLRIESLPYSLKHDMLSIVKESVSNILKHAQATEVQITILEQSKFYSLVILDNGIGCDLEKLKKGNEGIGLMVLKEIVEKHNGTIKFYSDKSNLMKGFKTHIIFPKVENTNAKKIN